MIAIGDRVYYINQPTRTGAVMSFKSKQVVHVALDMAEIYTCVPPCTTVCGCNGTGKIKVFWIESHPALWRKEGS